MAETAVVTDTTAYLPEDVLTQHDIHLVSLYVTLEGIERRESEITGSGYGEFFERLRRSADGATTSQPSVGDFIGVYEPLLAAGRDVVSIHISAGISGTCESARQARQRLIDDGRGGERIFVFDSRSGCGGQGMLVIAAARAAAAGADGVKALAAVERAREALEMWCAGDTLDYLRRGGRFGSAQALLGSAVQVTPIRCLEEGDAPSGR